PYVASILKTEGFAVRFMLSLSADDPSIKRHLVNVIHQLDVAFYFKFIGKVPSVNVHQVIKRSDAMILLSKLECFSSNIVEVFYFGKPLIISDEPWAHAECGDAVMYVDRDDPAIIANGIRQLIEDKELYNE